MDLTGFSQQVRQSTAAASKQIIDAMRQAVPDLPERVLQSATTIMNEEFAKAVVAPGGLVAQMAAIYAKHFTAEDLRALVAFYSTPAGQKALKALPLITQEAAGLGKAWGQQILPTIGAAVQARLRNEGLIR
jgi:hypothetical protein